MSGGFVVLYDMGFNVLREVWPEAPRKLNLPFPRAHEADRPPERDKQLATRRVIMTYRTFLLAAYVAVWTWAAIKPIFREDWLLENYLVFLFFRLILLLGFYFELSNVSYTLIALFGTLHAIGSHYTYSLLSFGYTLQHWFGAERNMYDRLVHFSFGLLLAYPVREAFLRIAKVRGFWGYYLPLDVTFALSAIYEIAEWIVASKVDPKSGLAFLGRQGDVWDAQKDMLLAGIRRVPCHADRRSYPSSLRQELFSGPGGRIPSRQE